MTIKSGFNRVLIPLLGAAVLAGCSRTSTLTREEARSQGRSALSLTAEIGMFIDQIRLGRGTPHYIEGEASYLQEAVRDSLKELQKSSPQPGTENSIRVFMTQLDFLDHELSRIPVEMGNTAELAAAQERILKSRQALEKANSSL
jgi:hypothetical protein